ncbi:MAG: hypothetical protein JSW48_06105 [Betaproteobacteria bacterium]|jgi:hypothetical protein|nr:MAG: hypothetical protein JSW48_06105 [Betaproteobacteria bacterium]
MNKVYEKAVGALAELCLPQDGHEIDAHASLLAFAPLFPWLLSGSAWQSLVSGNGNRDSKLDYTVQPSDRDPSLKSPNAIDRKCQVDRYREQ